MGPDRNVVWKTPLPPGHSSPVVVGDSIFVTAHQQGKLFVISLDRESGRIKWRREVPRPRQQELHKSNDPASPSVATDGKVVVAFFTDFGLAAFGWDGEQKWRLPLGPFNNPFGMGSSPLLVGDRIIQVCDSETDSFVVAVDKNTGKILWRVERPEVGRGFSTPVLYEPPGGPRQAIVPGSYRLVSYDIDSGKQVWSVGKFTWQLKPTPAIAGDRLYVLGWAGGSDEGSQEDVGSFEEALRRMDKDSDKLLSKQEIAAFDERLTSDWRQMDLDNDGTVGARDWQMYAGRRASVNSITAIKLGGRGDVTDTHVLWRYTRSLPNVPSPLFYRGLVYLMKESGILTALDAATGKVAKQGRLAGALDAYFSSPVAAEGRIYAISQTGKLVVIKAGPEWEVLAVNDLDEVAYATPALAGGRIYVRTLSALYAFSESTAGAKEN